MNREPAKPIIIGIIAILGIAVGLASSHLPVLVVLLVVGCIALFGVIYQDLYVGLILFLIVNLIIPQAGPSLDVGIQTPVGERGLHFNVHEIIMTMVLAAWLIKAFLRKVSWKKTSPMMIPIGLYVLTSILACFVGAMNGANPLVPVFRFTRTVFFVYIFFIVLNTVNTRKQFQRLVVIMLICATIVAGFGLVQKVMGQAWAEKVADKVLDKIGYPAEINYVAGASDAQAYRINSTFAHPNVLGGYLVMFLPFFVSMLWYYKEFLPRLLLLAGLVVNLVCLFFTGSRAAWVAAGVIAVIYGIFGLMDKRMVLALTTILLVMLIIVAILKPPEFVKERLISVSATQAADIRMYQYRIALDFIINNPLFGLGMGMEGEQIRSGYIMEMWAAVENLYLTYLVSHGIVGFIPFMLLFIVYWGMLLLVRNKSRGDPLLYYNSEALMLGVVGLMVSNMFGAWLLFAICMVTIWWFMFGMGGVIYKFYEEKTPVPAEERVTGPMPAVT